MLPHNSGVHRQPTPVHVIHNRFRRNPLTRTSLLAAATLMALLPAAHALDVSSGSYTYAENFDSLTTSTAATGWANDTTLPGWSLFIGTGAAAPTYVADTGSSNAGSFKSYGASGSSERALGGLGSGGAYFGSPASGGVGGYIAVSFTNLTGGALAGFTLGYDGEQWRNGGNTSAQTMVLQYGFGSSFADVAGWSAPGGDFDFTSPVTGSTAAAVDGNGTGRIAGLGGTVETAWAAGDTLWLRWVEVNDVGNDHALALDNFSFAVVTAPVPEPGTWALLMAGLLGVTATARRARRQ